MSVALSISLHPPLFSPLGVAFRLSSNSDTRLFFWMVSIFCFYILGYNWILKQTIEVVGDLYLRNNKPHQLRRGSMSIVRRVRDLNSRNPLGG